MAPPFGGANADVEFLQRLVGSAADGRLANKRWSRRTWIPASKLAIIQNHMLNIGIGAKNMIKKEKFGLLVVALILCIDAAQIIFKFFSDEATLVRFGCAVLLALVAIGIVKKVPQSRFVALVHFSIICVITFVALGACLATKRYPSVSAMITFVAFGSAIFILTRPSVRALFPSLSGKSKVKVCLCYVALIAIAGHHQQNVEIGKYLSKQNEADEHFKRGNQYFEEKQYDLAAREFESVLETTPDSSVARSNLRLSRERSSANHE